MCLFYNIAFSEVVPTNCFIPIQNYFPKILSKSVIEQPGEICT
jgi:hypothetical protein